MNKNIIKFGMFLLGLLLLLATDSFAQYRRYTHAPRPRPYYRPAPRVSVGIGVGGGYWGHRPYYRYRYRPGIAVGVGFPAAGAFFYSLPAGYSRFSFGGVPYYYYDNTYYVQNDKGYEVVAPPLGGTLDQLPRGTRLIKINGQNYYEFEGTYFSADVDNDGHKYYVVVGTNGELNVDEAEKARADASENMATEQNDQEDENGQQQPPADNSYNNNNNTYNNQQTEGSNDNDAVYDNRPQVGDQFDQLPKNSKSITVNGQTQYVSPAGTYYKPVTVDGKTVYEVTKGNN